MRIPRGFNFRSRIEAAFLFCVVPVMILTIALLLAFQLAGTAVVALTGCPVPGPVLGMVFFLFALMTVDGLLEKTLPVVNVLLAHFALLFVPAGVGIINHVDKITTYWLAISASILGSSILAMVTTVLVTRWVATLLARRQGGKHA